MGIGKVLGSVSPLYGMATGRGAFGRGMAALADSGMGGLGAMIAQRARDKRAGRPTGGPAVAKIDGMKKGGKAKKMAKGGSASKRADGIARKGKTKGRFV